MNKEKLLEYRKKLSQLSEKETNLRNQYLKGFYNNKIQGPLTGYASIDKPWVKYYTEEQLDDIVPKCSCYELLKETIENHPETCAIEFYGKKVKYKDLLKNIDKTADAYYSLGVRKKDIVTFLVVNAPEMVYSFYALNKIGAIPNMIDLRSNVEATKKYIEEVNSKYIVCIDTFYNNVKEATKDMKNIKIIHYPAINSMPLKTKAKLVYNAIKNKEQLPKEEKVEFLDNTIPWNDFMFNRVSNSCKQSYYKKDYPAAIVHTGGTTGVPKGVMLSNENFNAVANQVKNCPIEVGVGDKFLDVLMPFVAYGLALGMHAPMTLGWDTVQIPLIKEGQMPQLLKEYDPQVVMGIMTYFNYLLDRDDIDYKNMKAMLMGGMPTKAEFENKMNKKFLDNNGNFEVSKGYSMTELASCATCSFNTANEIGSNGVPLPKTVIAAFDPDTQEEKAYNEDGELCIQSYTMMLGYYNKPNATKEVIKTHPDGSIWVHSGDVGYVTENGFVYTKDRIKRMIIRDGFKVFPSQLEDVFLKHYAVNECAVIGIEDYNSCQVPVCYIKLNNQYKDNIDINKLNDELKELIIENGLPQYFTPVDFVYIDKLPLTNILKVDFKALEQDYNESKKLILKR